MNIYTRFIFIVIAALFQGLAIDILLFKIADYKIKDRLKQFFITLAILTVCQTICGYSPNQFRFMISLLSIIMISFAILKNDISQAMFSGIAIMIISSLCEIVISGFLVMFAFDSSLLINNFYVNFVVSLIIAMSIIIVSYTKIIVKIIRFTKKWFLGKNGAVYYVYLLIILIYLIAAKNGMSILLGTEGIINIIIFGLVMFLFVIILNSDIKNKRLTDQYQQTLNYVQKYEKIISDQGKANHEFKNQLMVIKGYAEMNPEKLVDYLNSLIDDVKKTSSSYLISQLNKFPDGGVKGLLYYKLSIMEDEKIKYEIYVEDGVKKKLAKLDINLYKNITKILGVVLDNAIEASKEAREKSIGVDVSLEKDTVIFNITNTYKGKIDLNKLGTGYSIKGNGRGFGLSLVNDILNKNHCLSIKRELIDKYYSTKLCIKVLNKRKK